MTSLAFEVPAEVWALILMRTERVKELGRLAGVNRLFNGLVTNVCWPTQVRALQIGPEWISLKTRLWKDGEETEPEEEERLLKLRTDPSGALSLVEKVARDARSLEGVHLNLGTSPALIGQCLKILVKSDFPKLSIFRVYHTYDMIGLVLPGLLAEFMAAKAATLKNFVLGYSAGRPRHRSQTSYRRRDTISFVLLKTVCRGQNLINLLKLRCSFWAMDEFIRDAQAGKPVGSKQSMGDHVLQNLQELTLDCCLVSCDLPVLEPFPFEDFPQLRIIRMDNLDVMSLHEMRETYFSLFHDQSGVEKVLEVQVKTLGPNPALEETDARSQAQHKALWDPIRATVDPGVTIPGPTLAVQFTFRSNPNSVWKKLTFRHGKAVFSIKVDSYVTYRHLGQHLPSY